MYGNILTDQNNIKLKLKVDQSIYPTILLENNEGWAKNGEIHLAEFTIVSSMKFEKINIRAEVDDYLIQHKIFEIEIAPCDIGDVFYDNRCRRCPENYYSFLENATSRGLSECNKCPLNAICLGGDQVLPLAGFWRSKKYSIILKCSSTDACIQDQSNSFNFSNQCGKGYTGNICRSCEEGYTYLYGSCQVCEGNVYAWLTMVIGFNIFFFFSILLKTQCIMKSMKENQKMFML